MVNKYSLKGFKNLLSKKKYSKIFLITGKKSFIKSGACKLISSKIKTKIKFFYKKNCISHKRL